MSYQVVAPLVIAKDHEGRPYHVYEGGVIQWLSDEQAAHFLGTGLVVKFGDSAADEGDDDGSDKPPASAKKEVLVAWLVENAAKEDGSDYTAEELDALTKAELSELIDSVE
ncbi:hypothetical protein [Mycobacterium sp. PSTR-4-N]|uniref:hypothetical protein n=1 Tax=Mycobacterium sp. PSTR-4-N TaxID=2917745 RepID=UPI001F151D53|nr:hypothetical protein [Mycobacterium sp. PSTR-4-N]MCG7596353.1 hypothetical protein [Mycobacterium sp. PSTR-4-N]